MTSPAPTAPFWRRTSFRLTILAAVVFAVSTGAILVYVYGAAASALVRRADAAAAAEAETLVEAYRTGGLNGLNRTVIRNSLSSQDFAYLLAYPNGARMSGQPDRLPLEAEDADGAIAFSYEVRERGADEALEIRRARGHVVPLPGEYRLLVWRDVDEDDRALANVRNQARTAFLLVLALGLLSGAFLSNRFVRRVDGLNDVARDVIAGDLSRRAPRTGANDELDTLAGNLNDMLDRIERLMTSMRHAGDSIAHDLRSPLTRMRNRLEAALISADVDRNQTLEDALSDADELLTTFQAVLRLSRLEAGEKRPALVSLDLHPMIEELAEMFEIVCEDAQLQFSAELQPGLTVRGDRNLILQAVSNLLDNAIKYTPDGGAVCLRLRKTGSGQVEVSVTDTGPGIAPELRDKVKQRFVRLDKSRTKPGTGLGLSLVQAAADIHSATFELDDGPGSHVDGGRGLRVALVFPAAEAGA